MVGLDQVAPNGRNDRVVDETECPPAVCICGRCQEARMVWQSLGSNGRVQIFPHVSLDTEDSLWSRAINGQPHWLIETSIQEWLAHAR
jgi:hypothetical protein